MPGSRWASIKHPRQYEALKRKGYSKSKAAAISNGVTYPGKSVKQARAYRRRRKKR
jgi:hypothetical protein